MTEKKESTLTIFHRARLIDEESYIQLFLLLKKRKLIVEYLLNTNNSLSGKETETLQAQYNLINADICKILAIPQ